MLTHKGYTGHIEFDDEARIFHGEVLDTRDVITFQGSSVEELIQAFQDSVDDYLEFCEQRGEEPDKPFSGRLNGTGLSGPPSPSIGSGKARRKEPESVDRGEA